MSNPGFRIKKNFERPSQEIIDKFAKLPVANIGDAMNRMSCMKSRVRPLNKTPLCGPAFTVRARACDVLLMHKSLDLAKPGDVIVVDVQGDTTYAIPGELMAEWARDKGIKGFIVDGCVRDLDTLSEMKDFAVYAAGINPNGPMKVGGGEIGFPISCGGIVVNPGDIIVGDQDGIAVISPQDADVVYEKAHANFVRESKIKEDIKAGTWDRKWIDEALEQYGCEFVD